MIEVKACTVDNGKMADMMDMESINRTLESNMKAHGQMDSCMDMESLYGHKALYISGSFIKTEK